METRSEARVQAFAVTRLVAAVGVEQVALVPEALVHGRGGQLARLAGEVQALGVATQLVRDERAVQHRVVRLPLDARQLRHLEVLACELACCLEVPAMAGEHALDQRARGNVDAAEGLPMGIGPHAVRLGPLEVACEDRRHREAHLAVDVEQRDRDARVRADALARLEGAVRRRRLARCHLHETHLDPPEASDRRREARLLQQRWIRAASRWPAARFEWW
jgi:hypothetical protein